MDLDTLLGQFEAEYLELNSISPTRRAEQLRLLRRLAESLDHPLSELNGQDVATFIGSELNRGLHPNTARKETIMVRSFAGWATRRQLAIPTLMTELKLLGYPRGSSAQNRPRPYKVSEIHELKRILAAKYPTLPEYGRGSRQLLFFMRGRYPALRRYIWRHARRLQLEAQIALALEQGLRRIEIFNLSIPAMHFDNDEVVVLTAKQEPGEQVHRAIPYTTHARTCVQEWLDFRSLLAPPHDKPWLALRYTRTLDEQLAPLSLSALHITLRVFGAGWEWGRLRHTAATEWLRAGVPLEKVRIFMGHATLEQTLAYAEIVSSDVGEAFGTAEAQFATRLGHARPPAADNGQ